MLMILGGAMLAQQLPQAGVLEGPANHPREYQTVESPTMEVASQANGLTTSRRERVDDKVRLLQLNSRLFDLYRGVGQAGPPPTTLPVLQGPPRLVHLEGERVRVARPAERPLVQADPQGHLTGDRDVIQAFHTTNETHRMAEGALGRPVRFASPDGRITVSLDDPTAVGGPAHDPAAASIVFPRNSTAAADPDVIAHETGHAVLTSQRPQYRSREPGTGAVHEAYADVAQLTLALRDPEVRRDVLARREGGNLATNVGEGMSLPLQEGDNRNPRTGLRDLGAEPPPGDEPHDASQRYSRAVYRSVLDVQTRLQGEGLSPDDALRRANEIVGGNALRAVDFLPVGPHANLEDLARATLAAGDQDQGGRYRAVMERHFRESGIPVGGPADRLRQAGYQALGQRPELRMPAELREGAQFGPSVGAERPPGTGPGTAAEDYLGRNREALGLPEGVNFRAHQLLRNDRGETFVHFSDGNSMTDENARHFMLLAFDRDGRPIHLQDSVAPPPPPPLQLPGPGLPPWPAPPGEKHFPALGIVA